MEKKTSEGVHLREAVAILENSGARKPVLPILRHGLVLEQVTAELREGKYHLLVIGSHHVAGRSKLLEAFLEDVASELASEAPCSVLIV
jgi:nucleotide-binding universal stress UspA family protein